MSDSEDDADDVLGGLSRPVLNAGAAAPESDDESGDERADTTAGAIPEEEAATGDAEADDGGHPFGHLCSQCAFTANQKGPIQLHLSSPLVGHPTPPEPDTLFHKQSYVASRSGPLPSLTRGARRLHTRSRRDAWHGTSVYV